MACLAALPHVQYAVNDDMKKEAAALQRAQAGVKPKTLVSGND
jgi:hypothetical protein